MKKKLSNHFKFWLLMIISPSKTYFPLLPFDIEIPYFAVIELNTNNTDEEKSDNYSDIDLTNNNCYLDSNNEKSFIKKKSPVVLNEAASIFKFSFYKIFTSKKKFPKKYVVMIHNEICTMLNLRKVNRDETRSIDLYFLNFAPYSDRILITIKNNFNTIINKIPELKCILLN